MADYSGDTKEGFKTPQADSTNLTESLGQDNPSTDSKVDPIMITSRNYYDQQASTSPWSLPEGSNSGDSNPDLIPGRRRQCNHQMTSSWTPVEDVDGHDSFCCDKCEPWKKREPKLQLTTTSACSIPNEPSITRNIHIEMADSCGDIQERSRTLQADSPNLTDGLGQDNPSTESKVNPVMVTSRRQYDQPRSTSPWSHAEGSHSGDSNPDFIPGRRHHCNHQMTSSWTPVEDVDGHDSFCCDKCAPGKKRESKLQLTTTSACSIPNEPSITRIIHIEMADPCGDVQEQSRTLDLEEKSSLEPAGLSTQDANVIKSGERRHYEQADCIPNEPPSSKMDFEEKSSREPAGLPTQDVNVIKSGERRHYKEAD